MVLIKTIFIACIILNIIFNLYIMLHQWCVGRCFNYERNMSSKTLLIQNGRRYINVGKPHHTTACQLECDWQFIAAVFAFSILLIAETRVAWHVPRVFLSPIDCRFRFVSTNTHTHTNTLVRWLMPCTFE